MPYVVFVRKRKKVMTETAHSTNTTAALDRPESELAHILREAAEQLEIATASQHKAECLLRLLAFI